MIKKSYPLAKAFKLKPALKGGFQAAFGLLSPIGDGLMGFASPKSTKKRTFKVAEFCK